MTSTHGHGALDSWQSLCSTFKPHHRTLLRGNSLDIPSLVAVSRYGAIASIDTSADIVERIDASVKFLKAFLKQGESVYGVTTGFGGSADTNTTSPQELQIALIQMQLCAVLPVQPGGRPSETTSYRRAIFSNGNALATLAIPEAWVRAAMLVRCNSLLRGHSAVRLSVIETLIKLLQNDLVPLVPLRGSVSASGDLCPLSYIAGMLEGNPDVYVWTGKHTQRTLVSADVALHQLSIAPISFGPKEVLGILNGTAVSVSVAALALHQADNLAVMSQVLTAMGVEALSGTIESFDPFIAKVRPHRGQVEVARNVLAFLKGSKLARNEESDRWIGIGHLRQDRYALRTASQWIGPQLEDLILAREQIEVELNSTTDNPVFDVSTGKAHHGGNFQAAAVTSSTEKTRLALQMIGKLMFTQSTELLDTRLNNGLPPNLAADEPSLSYTFKGVDINMAAYMSELAFLANPVSSHVQSAEMSNQGVNSLALISARYTHMAIDVLSLMSSAYLYSLCQALDLRSMNILFISKLRPLIDELTTSTFSGFFLHDALAELQASLWEAVTHGLDATASKDSSDRFEAVAQYAQPHLIQALSKVSQSLTNGTKVSFDNNTNLLFLVASWTEKAAGAARETFLENREAYLANPDATPYLGVASKRMYQFVREILDVPFHRGLADHPTRKATGERKLRNTGSQISIIYEALRDERLVEPIMACLKEVLEEKVEDVPKVNGESTVTVKAEKKKSVPKVNGHTTVVAEALSTKDEILPNVNGNSGVAIEASDLKNKVAPEMIGENVRTVESSDTTYESSPKVNGHTDVGVEKIRVAPQPNIAAVKAKYHEVADNASIHSIEDADVDKRSGVKDGEIVKDFAVVESLKEAPESVNSFEEPIMEKPIEKTRGHSGLISSNIKEVKKALGRVGVEAVEIEA